MEKKIKLLRDLVKYYLCNGQPDLGYNCEPFMNFLESIWKDVADSPFSNFELLEWEIEEQLSRIVEMPSDLVVFYSQLVSETKRAFGLYKAEHYIIVPLDGSQLSGDIDFGDFHLIAKCSEADIIKKIEKITAIGHTEIVALLDHTRTSRSPDFLKRNLLLIRFEGQTSPVKMYASTIAVRCIQILHLLYWNFGPAEDIFTRLKLRNPVKLLQTNSHVAILSADDWRCGHDAERHELPQCGIVLDFMQNQDIQKRFQELFQDFILTPTDGLTWKFLNSLVLLNKGYELECRSELELATLLYLTAGESLLTENRYEKRLRLTAILSRLVEIPGITQSELARTIEKMYKARNDFVHAGRPIEYEESRENDIDTIRKAISSLIALYFYLDTTLDDTNSNREQKWDRYVDRFFTSVIYGE